MDAGSSGKVLFATFDVIPDPTGTSAQTARTLLGLSAFHEVEVLSAKTPEHAHIERFQGARLLRVPVGSGDLRARVEAFSRAVRRQLQSEEYDLVHFTDPYGGYPVCELSSALGFKLVYEARSFPSIEVKYLEPELETDTAFITRLRRQEIFCLSNADIVLVPCTLSREYVLSLGVAPEKVHVSRPMVEKEPLGALPPPDGEPCRVLYLGNHASWQGLPSLLFALRFAMKREKMKVRIIGATHGSWQRQLQEMIREFGLRDHVTLELPVPHEDIPSILGQTDVVVSPLQKGDRNQEQGACPMKLAEAMSAGRCVITADLPITREFIQHDVSGLLYPPADEDALGDLLVKAARDPLLRCRLGAVAQATSGDFDAQDRRASLLHHYARLLNPGEEVERSVFRTVATAAPPERPGDETTQPKIEAVEGPTSQASLDELQSHLERADGEPGTSPGVDPGPTAEPAVEANEETSPRPIPEAPEEDTSPKPVPVGLLVAAPAAAEAAPETTEEDTGKKPVPEDPAAAEAEAVSDESAAAPETAEEDTGKKPVPEDPAATEDSGESGAAAAAAGSDESSASPESTEEDTGKKPVPEDPAAAEIAAAPVSTEEDTGKKPIPEDPAAAEAAAEATAEATAEVGPVSTEEDTGKKPIPEDPDGLREVASDEVVLLPDPSNPTGD